MAAWRPVAERAARDDLKWYLMNKYRALLTDKLTCGDLEDLKYCLRQQSNPKDGWDRRYRKQFVLKMGEFMQEDVLRTEITAIESLISLMKPEDLRKGHE